jgi:hypothetical protein
MTAKAPRPRRETDNEDEAESRKIDEASELSMDASDPPSFTHGTIGAGHDRRSTVDDEESELDRRIRDRAYQIWLEEGCPEGRAEEHWLLAKEMVATEDQEGGRSRY